MADLFMGVLLWLVDFSSVLDANTRVRRDKRLRSQFVLPPVSGLAFSASRSAMREMWKRWKFLSRS